MLSFIESTSYLSRRRWDSKYLDLQITIEICSTGTPFTSVKTCLKFWGLPSKCVWYVRELPWKPVRDFQSRNYVKSDLLRPWYLKLEICDVDSVRIDIWALDIYDIDSMNEKYISFIYYMYVYILCMNIEYEHQRYML